ncbi:hypothetical protein B0T22DRAFT_472135 [Podospora appendiculata]|uniref:HNH nuclease domain-containing protein n=1 Tax=Podospora appendiculata TaxID=314037 RepID=A0AAE0X1S5_9PEZI|nr:hypothetical protein B0T22DRAFT_472135 [Podospora appendiculata]
MDRDITCRLFGYMDAVENAHLVPVGERLWFVSNRMDKHCQRPPEVSAISDDKKILILRNDLRHLFDARRFTFVPKQFGTFTSESAELVTHVLLPSGSPELVDLYHNRSPQPIRGISVECLFARFAWSLFTDDHIPFSRSVLEYALHLWDEAKGETETQALRELDVRSRAQVFGSSRSLSQSASPKKRSLSTQGGGQDNEGDGYWSGDGDITGDDHDVDSWDNVPRGRPRKRSWETFGFGDGQVPSLSCSFASATQSSLASRPGKLLSQQPLTPEEGDTAASPEAAGKRPPGVKGLKMYSC